MKQTTKEMLNAALGLLMAGGITILIFLCLICGGCTTTKYVPVESVRTEYRDADTTGIYNRLLTLVESRREKESRSDSLVDREKETVVLNVQGDTVRITQTRFVYAASRRERELEVENKTLRDSVSILNTRLESIKSDSVPVPYPVERKLSRWERTKQDYGGAAMGGLAVLIVVAVWWLVKRKR